MSTRRLAAIMFADIKGYTAMMQKNEDEAVSLRHKFKLNLEQETVSHNGRILKFSGDGALCIFDSDVEAVHTAVAVQKILQEEPIVPVRIGIHSGDVIVDQGEIFGEGINVASDVETFAEPGGVFISGKVYDDIKNQTGIDAVSMGFYQFNHTTTPIEIFAVAGHGLAVPKSKTLKGKALRKISRSVKYSTVIWIVIAFLILIGGWLSYQIIIHNAEKNTLQKSVAVLPFTNLSPNNSDEYLADGIVIDITSQLSKISGLRVISNTSSSYYKHTEKTLRQIAEDLNVDYILQGSIQKEGNRLRLNLQLVDATNDQSVWAETYDRTIEDIFNIQSDIATTVANELHTRLSTDENNEINTPPTQNISAYQDFLQGNFYLDKRTPQGMALAKDFYEKAINKDSAFAAAYVGLANSYIFRSNFYDIDPDEGYPVAKKLVLKAIALNPTFADAHATLGIIYSMRDWNFPLAEKEFSLAYSFDKNNKIASIGYGRCLYSSKKFVDALNLYHQVLESDPNWRQPLNSIAWVYFFQGRDDSALHYIQKNLDLNPEFFQPYRLMGLIYLDRGRDEEALSLFKKSELLSGNNPEEVAYLGYGYARVGKDSAADSIISQLIGLQGDSKRLSFPIAMVYAGFQNKTKTFEYLEMAVENKTADIMLVDVFPQFDFLKSDPLYHRLVDKAGIVYLGQKY